MASQPTPWDTTRFFRGNDRTSLCRPLPDHMWLIPKDESTDRQGRIEITCYKGYGEKQHQLGFVRFTPPTYKSAKANRSRIDPSLGPFVKQRA